MHHLQFVLGWLVLLTIVLGQPAVELLAADPAPPKKITTVEGITEYSLENGLQVLLIPDASQPRITVNLTIFVGSRHEGYGETGMAHLLEHMVFKGTPKHPTIPKELQQRGANYNGTTWVDRTNYYETLPASEENLAFALELEADRMVNSYVKREDLLSEMTVVRNEFEQGENTPSHILNQRMMATAYEWHNYGKSTIGNRTDIERVPIDRLQAFYKKYYQPDNAMLVVAGKFDEKKALELIQKYFGVLPRPERKLDSTYTEEPAQDGDRQVTLRRVGDVAVVGALYHIPASGHPDVAAMEVLSNVLDAAPSGRLYKALVESKKATSVAAYAMSLHDPGVFEVDLEVPKQNSVQEVRDIMLDILEKVADTDFTVEEVERSKVMILKHRELQASDTSRIAVELSNWASQGDWRLYFLHRDRIEKITPKDVKAAAAKYLVRSNRTVGMFIPTDKSERATIPETPNLAKVFENYKGGEASASGESFDVTPANIEARTRRATLPEGIKAAYLPKKTRGESVNLRLVLRYGNLDSLKGYESAAMFMPQLMLRGTKNLTREQIQDALDKQGAQLSASGDTGTATFSLQTKRANLPAVLELLRQILREPVFPQGEFDVLQQQRVTGLEEQRANPQSIAILHIRRTLNPYPTDDIRYNATIDEELARVKSLGRDKVQKLYSDFMSSQAGELSIVGDFEPAECESILRETLAGWKSSQSYARIPKIAYPLKAGSKTELLAPDKANAVYVAGTVFPMKDDDVDYAPLVVGNFIFGDGALASRLGDRVRQKEGLSYGIGSFFAAEALDPRASITIFAICNPKNMPQVEKAVSEELEKLLKDGVTGDELKQAKQGYLQEQQVNRTNDASLARSLTDTLLNDRTMAYYEKVEEQVGSSTAEQVLAALRKYVNLKKLVIAEAGDFAAPAGK
jgi:zinc protease